MINAPLSIQENIPLAPLSTFNIGGSARYFAAVSSPEQLIEVVTVAKKENEMVKIFAGGSNVVFPDEGLDCLVIRITGGTFVKEDMTLVVDCGMMLGRIIDASIDAGLAGLETLSGIPGTVGGAVVGNAGAYGHSISEVVESVEIFDGEKTRWINREECKFAYRNSVFKEKPFLVLRARLQFQKGNSEELEKISEDIIKKREAKYKPGIKCPGSFFKNVLVKDVSEKSLSLVDQSKIINGKIPAGYLLDIIGARGTKAGGIQIADFHGNLFVNTGTGMAKDVKELASLLKEKVKEKFDIILEEEIRYL